MNLYEFGGNLCSGGHALLEANFRDGLYRQKGNNKKNKERKKKKKEKEKEKKSIL
jgi:hypothetical protein